jgi:hypothetical protein
MSVQRRPVAHSAWTFAVEQAKLTARPALAAAQLPAAAPTETPVEQQMALAAAATWPKSAPGVVVVDQVTMPEAVWTPAGTQALGGEAG